MPRWPARPLPQRHRQLAQAAEGLARLPDQLVGRQPHIGQAAHQRAKGDLPFEQGERCADAVVDAVAERDVPILLAPDVEPVGVGKLRWIAVGRAQDRDGVITGADLPLADLANAGSSRKSWS